MKYSRQQQQRFDQKETSFSLYYYDNMICISFEGMTRKMATEIGNDLISQMICKEIEVDWNGNTDLWLTEVDYAILNGFGTEDGLVSLLKNICEEYGYIATCIES